MIQQEDRKWLMLWSCVGVSLVYYVTPDDTDGHLISFFPFSDQMLTLRAYAYFAVVYASKMLYVLTIAEFAQKYKTTFKILFWVEVIAIINYILRYGNDFYFPGFDMTTLRIFVWTITAAVQIILNRRKLKYETK